MYYDLAFYNGSFGFNTNHNEIWGTNASPLVGRWSHIAQFFNGDATKSQLYVDGTLMPLRQTDGVTPGEAPLLPPFR